MTKLNTVILALLVLGSACSSSEKKEQQESEGIPVSEEQSLIYPQEKHFANMRQLTFGGDNAEAYWSYDDTKLVLQIKDPAKGIDCDQIFVMDVENDDLREKLPPMISTGKGRTTCSYFLPGDTTFVYASTHLGGDDCPPEPERREDGKYLWPVYDTYDIFTADLDGNILQQLTDEPGYDAEATVSAQGDKIVFTSDRSGDLELYTMDLDGSNVYQITDELGYDGGAFFSPDGTKLIFRSSRPETAEEKEEYTSLLAQGLVAPTAMELYICNVDGTDLIKLTDLGKANWAPFFHPSGEKIIFATNHAGARGFEFNLYMINIDGSGLERISYDSVFDAFPMFSYDGKKIVFSSNRNNGGTRETNLFVADWVE